MAARSQTTGNQEFLEVERKVREDKARRALIGQEFTPNTNKIKPG